MTTSEVLDMAGRVLFCFQDCNMLEVTPAPPCRVGCLGWLKPPADTLKLNVNAAWGPREGSIGIGAVIRNSDGVVLACLSR